MTQSSQTQAAQAEVRQALEALKDATSRKDTAAVVALGSRDHLQFSLAPPLVQPNGGPENLQDWFDTWDGPLSFDVRDQHIEVSGDVAYAHQLECLQGRKIKEGPVSLWYRRTVGLKKVEGVWKIAHEHTSVPFLMDGSGRAALDLKP